FKQKDVWPVRQRRLLAALERERVSAAAVREKEAQRKGSSVAEKLKNAVRTGKDDKKGALSSKLQSLWKQKKSKRTRGEDFHLLHMAVHDHHSSVACALLNDMSPAMFVKHTYIREANRIFLLAMANAMEPVCMIMLDKGFPGDVNAPVFKSEDSRFLCPSYFLMCVGLRLHNLVFHMVQNHRVKVNQDWYGLTPLHVATCKGSISVINILLENGANPRQGIPMQSYRLLRKLKNSQPRDGSKTVYRQITRSPTRGLLHGLATQRPASPAGSLTGMAIGGGSGGGVVMDQIVPIDIASVMLDQEVVNLLLTR
ncbi:hypothetical protein HKX48_008879, partial [Thoreauomyces humboldtii]